MTTTRLSRSGQPVMGTTILLAAENDDGPAGWIPAQVVAKLFGRGGNSDLIGLIVEWPDGGRQTLPWPMEFRRV